jgi:PadR family transcriptional regulator, regulatory protein AphA
MALRFALLGLLAVEPASGYDLKRAINRSTYFIWNATGPQIYNTLHKLREEGCVTSRSLAQDGKPDKQIHTITGRGRARLQEFMSEPIRAAVTRDEILLRIFFGNFADTKIIKRELQSYLQRIRDERSYLEATEARINAHPGRKHEARRFQLLSLRLKVAQYRAMEQELVRFLGADTGKMRSEKQRAPASGALRKNAARRAGSPAARRQPNQGRM